MTVRWQLAGAIARQAAPILVGQVAAIGYTVADTVMTGRHASTDLAALSIGASVYLCIYIALTGVMQALVPVVAHQHGAGDAAGVRRSFQQGVWLALMLSVPGILMLRHPGALLALAQADGTLDARVRDYLGWLAWSLPAGLMFRAYSGLNLGLSKPLLVTALQLMALALKVPLNGWLISGGLGVPALGVAGCAVATLLVQWTLVAVGVAVLALEPASRGLRLFAAWQPPRWSSLRELLRLGLPSGAALFFEVTGFALMAVFIARLGTVPLAGHQIAANVASVIYMLPLSIGIATGALAAQALGAQDPVQARRLSLHGLGLSLGLIAVASAVLLQARGALAAVYSTDAAVQAMASQLLLWVAFTQFGDATQCVASFALRSYRIAALPAAAYAVGLWGVGLGGGYTLAFLVPAWWPSARPWLVAGASAFWLANGLALLLVCALLLALLLRAAGTRARGA